MTDIGGVVADRLRVIAVAPDGFPIGAALPETPPRARAARRDREVAEKAANIRERAAGRDVGFVALFGRFTDAEIARIGAPESRVYFLAADEQCLVKIGVTSRLKARIESLVATSPVPLRLIGSCAGDVLDERKWHLRFADRRRHGEWFEMSDELQAAIAEAVARDRA